MKEKRLAGGATLPLVLLALVIGLGGANYYRNLTAEQAAQGPRPFESYSLRDLTKLREAYTTELELFEKRYASQQQNRFRARGKGTMGERLGEFERIQQNSGKLREINTEVAERQARLREIIKEIDYRGVVNTGLDIHIKRLTSI